MRTHTILIDIFPGKLGFIWLPFEIGVLDALSEAIQQFSNHPECVIMKITAMVMYSCVFFVATRDCISANGVSCTGHHISGVFQLGLADAAHNNGMLMQHTPVTVFSVLITV